MKKAAVILILAVLGYMTIFIYEHLKKTEEKTESGQIRMIEEGRYIGRSKGFVGDITVEVVFERENSTSNPVMTRVDVLESQEINKYWIPVKESIIKKVLEQQSLDIDTITGATESSQGLLKAIDDAKTKAFGRN